MNQTVAAIGKMHFEGNIIPMAWFSKLRFENGKPHTVAIICLSEIIYWYKPTIIRDEASGKITGYRQKFKADKWQCHYQAMADRFGFTKDQVRNALHFLRDGGYISLEFRPVVTTGGMPLSNVLFVEPIPEKIAELTYQETENAGDEGGVSFLYDTPPVQEGHPLPTETDTYTETPKETLKNLNPHGASAQEQLQRPPMLKAKPALKSAAPEQPEPGDADSSRLLLATSARIMLRDKFHESVTLPDEHKPPKKFPTLDMAREFDKAAERLNSHLEQAIDAGLKAGLNTIPRLVAYLIKFDPQRATNGGKNNVSPNSRRISGPVQPYKVADPTTFTGFGSND